MRYLRAALAVLLLLLLLAGLPAALALTIGNPLDGWEALCAGDVSDTVLLDVLAAIFWAAWAAFAWAVLREILALTAGASRPHLPASLPGPQHLAHTLVTAVLLVLPVTSSLTSTSPATHTTATLHLTPTAERFSLTRHAPAHPPHPGVTSTPGPTTPLAARTGDSGSGGSFSTSGIRPTHRAALDVRGSSPSSAQFILGSGVGLIAGVSLRELARLRRRQWRHRRPGRAVPTVSPEIAELEKALTQPGHPALSDTDRAVVLAAHAATADQPMAPARGLAPWDALCDAAGAPLPHLTSEHSSPISDPRSTHPAPSDPPEPGRRVLASPLETLLTTAATTTRDIDALAPVVHEQVRRFVQRTDPDLNQDLRDWHSPHNPRPRLSLLGPINLRSNGELPSSKPRKGWHTEVITYLAAHPRGVAPRDSAPTCGPTTLT